MSLVPTDRVRAVFAGSILPHLRSRLYGDRGISQNVSAAPERATRNRVRALAEALVERKVVSGRRSRQILFAAYRKQFRRWRTVAEKDRRNQQAWAAELCQALGRVA